MSTMWGADYEQLEQLAGQFFQAADTLETIANGVTASLYSTSWVGSDEEAFREYWQSRCVSALTNVTAYLRQGGHNLQFEASQQSAASNDSMSSVRGTSSLQAPSGISSLIGQLLHIAETAVDILPDFIPEIEEIASTVAKFLWPLTAVFTAVDLVETITSWIKHGFDLETATDLFDTIAGGLVLGGLLAGGAAVAPFLLVGGAGVALGVLGYHLITWLDPNWPTDALHGAEVVGHAIVGFGGSLLHGGETAGKDVTGAVWDGIKDVTSGIESAGGEVVHLGGGIVSGVGGLLGHVGL